MRLRHLLFFIGVISLSGCFAAYIPEPRSDNLSHVSESESAVIAFSVSSSTEIEKKSRWNRINGSNSLGHQYLFPGFPVTRLYFERGLNDVLGEYLLYHPRLGRGHRAVSNLSSPILGKLFGSRTKQFKVDVESFSTSAQDFFFLRKAITEGRINLSLNNANPIQLEFSSSRFISKATVEVISELIEESLFNALEESSIPNATLNSTSEVLPITTIICIGEKSKLEEEDSCLSKRNISIGVEDYFRKKNLSFISFRDSCPEILPKHGFLFLINTPNIEEQNDKLNFSGALSLADLANDKLEINSQVVSKVGQPDLNSNEPNCAGVRQLSEKLVSEFLQNERE